MIQQKTPKKIKGARKSEGRRKRKERKKKEKIPGYINAGTRYT